MKKIKLKKCKVCGCKFEPKSSLNVVCESYNCKIEYYKKTQKKGQRARKKESVGSRKKRAEKPMSRFVRKRDCIITMQSVVEGRCVTCGNIFKFEELQGGHQITRSRNATFLHPYNIRGQCSTCNWEQNLGLGQQVIFADKIIDRYGLDNWNLLYIAAKNTYSFTVPELKELMDIFEWGITALNSDMSFEEVMDVEDSLLAQHEYFNLLKRKQNADNNETLEESTTG